MIVHTIDLHFLDTPHAIAAFVAVGPGGPVLVETGPGSTLPALLRGLEAIGFGPDDISHVLVTHVHLDHAGAAGWWARRGAHVYVHEFGARHLVEPSRLLDSARRLFGDQLRPLWGDVLPVPEDRVTSVEDGDVIDACGLRFVAIETPGHARHHHAFRLGDACFAGDAAGMVLPGEPMICPPTPPPEFDPVAWQASIDRLEAEGFSRVYLTHFGEIDHPAAHFQEMRRVLDEHTQFTRERLAAGMSREAIIADYTRWYRDMNTRASVIGSESMQYVSDNLLHMNVDGMMRYWNQVAEAGDTPVT